MQDFTLQHANTFFFITTIAVSVLIIILVVLLYIAYRVYLFIQRTIVRIDTLLDNATEHTETNPIYKKSLPYILPILGYIFGKKRKVAKK
jgi:hypothetical protein